MFNTCYKLLIPWLKLVEKSAAHLLCHACLHQKRRSQNYRDSAKLYRTFRQKALQSNVGEGHACTNPAAWRRIFLLSGIRNVFWLTITAGYDFARSKFTFTLVYKHSDGKRMLSMPAPNLKYSWSALLFEIAMRRPLSCRRFKHSWSASRSLSSPAAILTLRMWNHKNRKETCRTFETCVAIIHEGLVVAARVDKNHWFFEPFEQASKHRCVCHDEAVVFWEDSPISQQKTARRGEGERGEITAHPRVAVLDCEWNEVADILRQLTRILIRDAQTLAKRSTITGQPDLG